MRNKLGYSVRCLQETRILPDEYKRERKVADWCQAQWEVYKMAIKQFYGVEYCFTRTDKYYGLVTEDETDWLFKVERKESKDNGKEIQEIAL